MKKLLILSALLSLLAAPAWAFPDNAVLDTFTGCVDNTSPPNSNWTNAIFVGATQHGTDCEDLAMGGVVNATAGDAYWNPTTFNANVEAYSKLATGIGSTAFVCVAIRLVNIGANTTDGYQACLVMSTDTVEIYRIDNAALTLLGTGVSITNGVAGDQVGIRAAGSQICSWYKVGAGAWTEKECVTDGTYSAGGRIGLRVLGAIGVGLADDFGGGNLVASGGSRRRN